jgi:hypothetical protein
MQHFVTGKAIGAMAPGTRIDLAAGQPGPSIVLTVKRVEDREDGTFFLYVEEVENAIVVGLVDKLYLANSEEH